MSVAREVDCMACRATGISVPLGTMDASGIVHYVKWSTGGPKGCFRACDFDDSNRPRTGARGVNVSLVIYVEDT